MSKAKGKRSKKYEKHIGTFVKMKVEDHWANGGGWNRGKELMREPLIVDACGIVVFENDKIVQLSNFVDPEGDHGSVFTVLKNCITKRKIVK